MGCCVSVSGAEVRGTGPGEPHQRLFIYYYYHAWSSVGNLGRYSTGVNNKARERYYLKRSMLSNTTNKKKASKQKVLKQIAISQENYDALQKLGNVPESFNDVITRVLDYYKTR